MGFVLVFALITGTIGLVFATGLDGLASAQHEEQVRNAERAFDVLADNVEGISAGDSPSRATELKLAGGSISTGDSVSIVIRAENQSDSNDNVTYSIAPEPIVFADGEGTRIVYTSGAVLRSESGNAVMVRDPNWIVRTDRTVLPLVNTGGSGSGIAGDGPVLVITQRASKTLGEPLVAGSGTTVRVNVTVTSPRIEAWNRYLRDQGFVAVDSDPDGDNVTYRFDTDALYVPRTTVEVSFDE